MCAVNLLESPSGVEDLKNCIEKYIFYRICTALLSLCLYLQSISTQSVTRYSRISFREAFYSEAILPVVWYFLAAPLPSRV